MGGGAVTGPRLYLVQVIMQRGKTRGINTGTERIFEKSTAKKRNLVARERHIQDLPADSLGIREALLECIVR